MTIPKHPFLKITMTGGNKASMDFFGEIMSDDAPEADDKGQPIPGVKFGAYKGAIDSLKGNGVTDLDLLINTPGGDVVAGLAMYDLNKACGLNIDCLVTGMCASMGTVVMLSGNQLPMATPGALLMFHKPKAGEVGEASKLRESADLLDKMEARVLAIYCEAFDMEEGEAKKLMKPGVNKWMTAKEAEDNGIIRGIAERPAQGQNAPANLTKPNARMSAADAFAKYFTTQTTTEKPNMKLTQTTLDKLKLTASSNDADFETAIAKMIADKEAAELKVTALEREKKAENKNRAVMLVDKAIASRLITAAEKDEYVTEAENNYAFVEKAFAKMKPAGGITSKLKVENGETVADTGDFQMTDAEKKYSFRDWEKKNSKKLGKMKVDAQELYIKLHTEEYGVAPKL